MSTENLNLADGNEPAASPASFRRKNPLTGVGGGNLLLAALFFGGIAFVYLLSLHGGPQKASAQQQMAESQVDELLSRVDLKDLDRGRSASSIVESFYCEARQRQIPLDRLRCNPFLYRPAPAMVLPVPMPESRPAAPEQPASQLAGEMLDAVRGLVLQSVLTGARGNTAMISNNLLTEGQTIRGWTIRRIDANEVVLVWKDRQYVLKMHR